jgi:small-conductance mechanosensitive channel
MPKSPELNALIFELWADLHNVKVLWQALVIFISLFVAWLVGGLIQPRLAVAHGKRAFGLEMLSQLQLPLTALALVLVGRAILQQWQSVHMLSVVVPLLTSFAILRFAVLMLRQVFAPSGWRDTLTRGIGWAVWIGNFITVDKFTGQLTRMTARYVVLRGLTGVEAIIPNETIITSTVINHSYTDRRVCVPLAVQVSYQSDLDAAIEIMEHVAQRHARVLHEPAPKVLIKQFGDRGSRGRHGQSLLRSLLRDLA